MVTFLNKKSNQKKTKKETFLNFYKVVERFLFNFNLLLKTILLFRPVQALGDCQQYN